MPLRVATEDYTRDTVYRQTSSLPRSMIITTAASDVSRRCARASTASAVSSGEYNPHATTRVPCAFVPFIFVSGRLSYVRLRRPRVFLFKGEQRQAREGYARSAAGDAPPLIFSLSPWDPIHRHGILLVHGVEKGEDGGSGKELEGGK